MGTKTPTFPDPEQSRVKIQKDILIEHLVAQALEVGTVDDMTSPPDPQSDDGVSWSLKEVDSWDIDPDGERIILSGTTTGTWSEQVSRTTRHHPAEYESHEMPVEITVVADFENSALGEFEIEVVSA